MFFPKILGFTSIWVTVARYDSHANDAREISHRLYDENTARALQTIQLCTESPKDTPKYKYIADKCICRIIHIMMLQ